MVQNTTPRVQEALRMLSWNRTPLLMDFTALHPSTCMAQSSSVNALFPYQTMLNFVNGLHCSMRAKRRKEVRGKKSWLVLEIMRGFAKNLAAGYLAWLVGLFTGFFLAFTWKTLPFCRQLCGTSMNLPSRLEFNTKMQVDWYYNKFWWWILLQSCEIGNKAISLVFIADPREEKRDRKKTFSRTKSNAKVNFDCQDFVTSWNCWGKDILCSCHKKVLTKK